MNKIFYFLKQTSQTQNIFVYNSHTDDYKFLIGSLHGMYVKDIVIENKDDLKTYLKDLFNHPDTNTHTKLIIKEIANKYYKKKIQIII
jgi:hypothetical protein